MATARSKSAWTAGLHDVSNLTVPTLSSAIALTAPRNRTNAQKTDSLWRPICEPPPPECRGDSSLKSRLDYQPVSARAAAATKFGPLHHRVYRRYFILAL